jgi:putative two-component system response regulator
MALGFVAGFLGMAREALAATLLATSSAGIWGLFFVRGRWGRTPSLPAPPAPVRPPTEVPVGPHGPEGDHGVPLSGLRLLLVDDDAVGLITTARILQRLGAEVEVESSPSGALATISGDATFDLLITDIVMPDMSGFTLVDLVARVRPGLPVVYISGFPQEEVYWGGSLGGRTAFLSKPLDPRQVARAVTGLLSPSVPRESGAREGTPRPTAPVVRVDTAPPDPRNPGLDDSPSHEGRIMVVDDDEAVVGSLQKLFTRAGYERPVAVLNPTEVRARLAEEVFDLMVLDLNMPVMDGFQVLEAIQGVLSREEYFPILILTGDDDPSVRRRALAAGAMDFLNKPFDPAEAEARVRNLLATRFLTRRVALQRDTLEERVLERTAELADTKAEILVRLARAAEYRDDVTGRHAERVGLLSSRIADEMGLPPMEVDLIRRTAPLHDIGKIGVPDTILRKPGRLTPAEFEVMKTHTTIGASILGGSRQRLLESARDIALCHHERWDGLGYPHARAGADIPLEARIVAVADTFDTIAHARPYKHALSPGAAVAEIVRCRGTHYDPGVVDAFLSIRDRVGQGELHGLGDPLDPLRDTTSLGSLAVGMD